ncbi:hypothetical protein KXQ82_17850 [Mucilaginibacter sp. HMF5004]|uniref:DUF5908 family protein n=1 Tax=Mucilaginibacter rivuli TaxID=2857527 RepID=UPI001C5F8D9B|nr:DUF5908 family protein [Mucilaginibacter rivuli]MBW4891595.1 hypothetical protein [Mucilaginibacter rivuli]
MPIEIRELKIRVTVDDNVKKKNGLDVKDIDALTNRIVKECVDKVMAKLNNLTER